MYMYIHVCIYIYIYSMYIYIYIHIIYIGEPDAPPGRALLQEAPPKKWYDDN